MLELHPADPSFTRNFHKNGGEERGDDVLIRGLAIGTDCIIDNRVTVIDAKSNISRDPENPCVAPEKGKGRSV
jgi:hypothetical protein